MINKPLHKHVIYIVTTTVLLTGCSTCPVAIHSTSPVQLDGKVPQILQTAETLLRNMHFTIDKSDPDAGILKTHPLPGAQWFECWRRDNMGWNNHIEANLQSIRRTVEMRFIPRENHVLAECRVTTERFNAPQKPVTNAAHVYTSLSRSSRTLQNLAHNEHQEHLAGWSPLGQDQRLADAILRRLETKLNRTREQ